MGIQGDGAEVVIAGRVELVGGEGGTRGKDARELALHKPAGLRGLGLVADGDLLAGGEELGDIIVAGMGRDARHRVILALRQGQPEEA